MKQADIVISYNEIEHSAIFSHSDGDIKSLNAHGSSNHQSELSTRQLSDKVFHSWEVLSTHPTKR